MKWVRLDVLLCAIAFIGCITNGGGVNLWDAVTNDDAAAIRRFAAAGGNVNVRGWNGSTPLWTAYSERRQNAFAALLENGADPNVVLSQGRSVIHWSADENEPDLLRLALVHGGNPNLVNPVRGGTPLYWAVSHDSVKCVDVLVTNGADMELPDAKEYSLIAIASGAGSFKSVLYFLEHGAEFKNARTSRYSFLENICMKCNNPQWFLRQEVRDDLARVRRWLEEHGAMK